MKIEHVSQEQADLMLPVVIAATVFRDMQKSGDQLATQLAWVELIGALMDFEHAGKVAV